MLHVADHTGLRLRGGEPQGVDAELVRHAAHAVVEGEVALPPSPKPPARGWDSQERRLTPPLVWPTLDLSTPPKPCVQTCSQQAVGPTGHNGGADK